MGCQIEQLTFHGQNKLPVTHVLKIMIHHLFICINIVSVTPANKLIILHLSELLALTVARLSNHYTYHISAYQHITFAPPSQLWPIKARTPCQGKTSATAVKCTFMLQISSSTAFQRCFRGFRYGDVASHWSTLNYSHFHRSVCDDLCLVTWWNIIPLGSFSF